MFFCTAGPFRRANDSQTESAANKSSPSTRGCRPKSGRCRHVHTTPSDRPSFFVGRCKASNAVNRVRRSHCSQPASSSAVPGADFERDAFQCTYSTRFVLIGTDGQFRIISAAASSMPQHSESRTGQRPSAVCASGQHVHYIYVHCNHCSGQSRRRADQHRH